MESPDLNMKGTPVLSTLADTRIPREASTVRRICGLSSGQIYDVMAWEQIHCTPYSKFTSIPSSCPSLSPSSLVEDQQSLWPVLLAARYLLTFLSQVLKFVGT